MEKIFLRGEGGGGGRGSQGWDSLYFKFAISSWNHPKALPLLYTLK